MLSPWQALLLLLTGLALNLSSEHLLHRMPAAVGLWHLLHPLCIPWLRRAVFL